MNSGEFFSRQYLRPTELLRDSVRFRKRLEGFFFDRIAQSYGHAIAKLMLRELGVQVPIYASGYYWVGFFEDAELRDVLGIITAAFRVASENNSSVAATWLTFCSRALDEEAMGYRVDQAGGVHYLVDAEFDRSIVSTIPALELPVFAHAKDSIGRLMSALDKGPDTLNALRSCWDANENVFKLVFEGKPPRLTESELKLYEPRLRQRYENTALNSASQMKEAFAKWVTAMHQYRHAPHSTEPSPPPLDLAVLMISQGLAFLRWQAGFVENAG